MGAASTYRPFGIIHSKAWLVSSVASAKDSALPASPVDGTSDTGLANHSDSWRSVRLPEAATGSQDPSGALTADAPPSVTCNAVSFHRGGVDRLALQRLDGIAPQANNLRERLRIGQLARSP